MDILLRVTYRLFAALLVLLIAALALGHFIVYPAMPIELPLCDGVPCVGGIIPGESSWSAAQSAIGESPEFMMGGQRVLMHIAPGIGAEFEPNDDGTRVGRTDILITTQSPVTVGWVMHYYGLPCETVRSQSAYIWMYYDHSAVRIVMDGWDGDFTPNNIVDLIRINDPSVPDRYPLCDSAMGWRGFTVNRFVGYE